ncbi:MAG: LamG-like jellyroll fold domain-containing protein [Propionibacteriaceae bacterium]
MTAKKAWTISIAASVLLVAGVFVALFGLGYHFYVVETPSMATTAPVGTLVVVHAKDSYAIGDVISYQAKTRVHTHRIVDQTAQGWITRGDLNGAADPLPVTADQIIGTVDFYGKYVGFFIRGLPWVLLGWAIIFALTMHPRIRPSWRWQIRLIGWSLVVSLVALWLRPWVNLVMTGYVPAAVGVDMHLVNTGIFPVDVLGTVLQSGQDATVNQTIADPDGKYRVTPTLALTFGWFLMLFAICATPFIASLFIRVEDDSDAEPPVANPPKRSRFSIPGVLRPREVGLISMVAVASVTVMAILLQAGSQATFASQITNSTNSAGTRTWFNCKNAVSNSATPAYLAWALGTSGATTEADLSTNGHTGQYAAATTTTPTLLGCNQDTPKAAVTFNGSQCLYVNANYATTGYAPNTFSLEAWFRTGTKSNGKVIGFGASRNTVTETNWDRHIYLDKDGRVVFGVYPGVVQIVYTKAGVNYADNQWHHVIATLSSAGQSLYVDGTLAMTKAAVTTAEGVSGYWKVGCGNLANWQNAATAASGSTALDYTGPQYFTGQVQYAAVYSSALTATQVKEHYLAGSA